MATIGELLDRISDHLQDPNDKGWSRGEKRERLLRELDSMARDRLFAQVTWIRAVAGTATYTVPGRAVGLEAMVYDERPLRFASEETLVLKRRDFERDRRRPRYWTADLQSPATVRVVPEPIETGSADPVLPPAGPFNLTKKGRLNFFAIAWENPQSQEDEGQEVQVPDWVEEILVFRTVAAISGLEGDFQDLTKSQGFRALADLMLEAL